MVENEKHETTLTECRAAKQVVENELRETQSLLQQSEHRTHKVRAVDDSSHSTTNTSGLWEQPYECISRASPAKTPNPSTMRNRKSSAAQLAPIPQDAEDSGADGVAIPPDAVPVRDPSSCTINELKFWLASIDYALPLNRTYRKQDLIDLVMKHDPRMQSWSAADDAVSR
uniref:Uncharacterized protein n=2 Tax=Lygus hesperus TaxID=30085 RepID=A0A0A9XT91_LYGHE